MIYINPDPHETLNQAFQRLQIKNEKVIFVQSKLAKLHSNFFLIRLILMFISSVIHFIFSNFFFF